MSPYHGNPNPLSFLNADVKFNHHAVKGNDYVVRVDFETAHHQCCDAIVGTHFKMTTKGGDVIGPAGGKRGTRYWARGPKLVYISGRSGEFIDNVVLHFNYCLD